MSKPTILDRLNSWSESTLSVSGEAALEAAVDAFYTTVLVDPELVRFFKGQDPVKLRKHQFEFMKAAFSGGKFKYSLRSMDKAHDSLFRMGLGGKEFDLVAGHLVAALKSLNVPQDIINDVLGVVGPLRPIFVDGYNRYNSGKPAADSSSHNDSHSKQQYHIALGGAALAVLAGAVFWYLKHRK